MQQEETNVQGINKGVTKGELREEGDGLKIGVDTRGSSPSNESERCMTIYIPCSILNLTTGGVFKVEADKWEGVQILVDTFVRDSGSPYTVYLPAQSSNTHDPLSASLEFSHMVKDNKDVALS